MAKCQHLCDDLTKQALNDAKSWLVPFRDLVSDLAFMLCDGKLVGDALRSLDACIVCFQGLNLQRGFHEAGRTLQKMVLKYNLTHVAVRLAYLVKSTLWCHTSSAKDFHNPFYKWHCRSWGYYNTGFCFVTIFACLMGVFVDANELMQDMWSITSHTTLRFVW